MAIVMYKERGTFMNTIMHTIYTAGYATWTPETLFAEARRLHAHVVDIRANPTSMRPEWRRAALLKAGRDLYEWEPCLGNSNYATKGAIVLRDPAQALVHLAPWLQRQSLILLCGCRAWQSCHRAIAADYLSRQLGVPVIHLESPVPPAGYMKALTVRQPWAWALMEGGKDIENRTWATTYRGPLAIHAAAGMTQQEYRRATDYLQRVVGVPYAAIPKKADLSFGAFLGTVQLADCVTTWDSPWFEGPYGFVVKTPRRLDQPIPAKGRLGLWDWPIPAAMPWCPS